MRREAHDLVLWARLLLIAGTAVAAILIAVPPAAGGSASETVARAELPDFYDPPARVNGKVGTVLRSEPLPLSPLLPAVLPGTAQRMMYVTRDSRGTKTAVSGAVIESKRAWRGEGDRPVIGFAVGTMGQGDQCSPSFGLENPLVVGIGTDEFTVSLNYEILAMGRLLARGFDIALTDYVGLGTSGRVHTYVNRVDEGRALLDAVRASRSLGIDRSARVGLWGYSQGGGATAAAAELQPTYARGMDLVGTFSGAPPADLSEVLTGIDGNIISGVVGFALNGFMQSYPELGPVVRENLNEEGAAVLDRLSRACIGDAILEAGFAQTSSWTVSGESLSDIIAAHPVAQAVIEEQRIGRGRPTSPVLVTSDRGDNTVPHGQVVQLAKDWCAQGVVVDFRPLGLPGAGDPAALNHVSGLVQSLPGALAWMEERFTGAEAVPDCP